ncbi:MAG TPA: MerR family transcriptional regulator [Hyphomicrobiaceae bacterium]|nr:MerR family transcriptional regulator [Hyphomicrobiaceae bacterium]
MARAAVTADKSTDAFRTISEVAESLDVPKHVLRFWELKFTHIRPMKRGGGRRFYRPEDVELLRGIQYLLHGEGYTIRGVQKILRRHGIELVKSCWRDGAAQLRPEGFEREEPGARTQKAGATAAKAGKRRDTALLSEDGGQALIASAIRELTACRELLTGLLRAEGSAKGRPG